MWGVFLQTSHKIVILSEAPHRFIAWYSAGRGVEEPVLSVAEGTSRGAYSTHAVGTLSTTEARTWRTSHGSKIRHRLGRCTRDHQERTAGRIQFLGLGSRKAPNSIDKISSLEVLRLRAI